MSDEDKGTEDTGSEDTSAALSSDDASEDTDSEDGEGTEDADTSDSTDDNSDDGEGDDETPEQKIERLEKTNKQLHARLKKKPKVETKPKAKKSNSDISRDEVRLMANGMSDEDIDSLKRIQAGAKALGDEISLTEAAKDPAFVALQEKNERDKASGEAGLDASGKSKISKDKPKYHDGQSKEDHKKQWLKDKDSQK